MQEHAHPHQATKSDKMPSGLVPARLRYATPRENPPSEADTHLSTKT